MSDTVPPIVDLTGAWDYRTLPPEIVVGRDCFIERRGCFDSFRSRRRPGLVLGDGVSVYTWAGFGVEENGLVEVGDDCVLVGPLFMCAEHISLGARVVVSYNVTIADCDFHPRDPDLRSIDAMAIAPGGDRRTRPRIVTAPVRIDDDASVGIGATVLKGVHVGAGARVLAGSVVTDDVPAGATVQGNPARRV